MELNQEFWQDMYSEEYTPWDIGHVSPPIKDYVDALPDKHLRILIPGSGKAHEAIYLHRQGFSAIYVCDWVRSAFDTLLQEAPDFPQAHLLVSDFFALEGEFDLILEQTFFCAIDPSLRSSYAAKTAALLAPHGSLVGLLFATPFEKEGPPFGGTESEYRTIFQDHYELETLESAKNSILPRAQNELFFKFNKK